MPFYHHPRWKPAPTRHATAAAEIAQPASLHKNRSLCACLSTTSLTHLEQRSSLLKASKYPSVPLHFVQRSPELDDEAKCALQAIAPRPRMSHDHTHFFFFIPASGPCSHWPQVSLFSLIAFSPFQSVYIAYLSTGKTIDNVYTSPRSSLNSSASTIARFLNSS